MTSTLELSRRFAKAGFTEAQAELLAETAIEIPEANLATKGDLGDVKLAVEVRLQRVENELNLLKWMLGTNLLLTLGVLWSLLRR